MRNPLRPYKVSMIIGFLFTLFTLLGYNSEFISQNAFLTWSGIIGGTVILYVFVFGILNTTEYISFGILGMYFGKIGIALAIPICFIIYDYYNPKENSNEPKSLLEKENLTLRKEFKECQKIKYGTFWNGYDTIIRHRSNDKDYETIKSFDGEKIFLLKWMDSCTYIRIYEESSLAEQYIQLGNFNNNQHVLYSKPAALHTIKDQRIETIRVIQP